jgi:HK97 family phage prohead protease
MANRFNKIEIRSAGSDPTKIVGVAAVYNSPSEDMGFIETLQPGCFTKSLQENQNIRALFNHDQNLVIGSRKNNTLTLNDKADGLYFEVTPTPEFRNTTYFASIERGDVQNCSFMFEVVKDKWTMGQDGRKYRTILEAKIFEVSMVTFPAYEATTASTRSVLSELTNSLERRTRSKMEKLTKEEREEVRAILLSLQALLISEDDDDTDTNQNSEPEQVATPEEDESAVEDQTSMNEQRRIDEMRMFLMTSLI